MKIPFLLFLLSTQICMAQTDTIQYKAGAELRKFSRIHFTGAAVETFGVVLTFLSATTIPGSNNSKTTMASAGAVISLVGVLIEATSYKHIKRAGIILQGNGIAIPLDRPKAIARLYQL